MGDIDIGSVAIALVHLSASLASSNTTKMSTRVLCSTVRFSQISLAHYVAHASVVLNCEMSVLRALLSNSGERGDRTDPGTGTGGKRNLCCRVSRGGRLQLPSMSYRLMTFESG